MLPDFIQNKILLYIRHPVAQLMHEYHSVYCYNGYNIDGYNHLGYDRYGYNKYGYDQYGECKWCCNTPCMCCVGY